MRAVVLSIGSELVEGHLTDTNATFLAQELAALGIELVGVSQVGDNLARIIRALERGWRDAELIITTGGIGPTEDDLTREAIAALLQEEVRVDPELRATIEAFFRARGLTMPEQNSKQAWLIPSAEALPNPMGTAPGWFVRRGGRAIVSMPGVPREMTRMWREQAVPRLAPFFGDRAVVSRTLKTIGIGESAAEQLISDIIRRGDPIVATYAKDDGVHVRVTASAASEAEAGAAVDRVEAEVRQILGEYIYGGLELSLGSAILAPLVRSERTLAIGEAGGGGRVTELLADEPEADQHLLGSLIRGFEMAQRAHADHIQGSGSLPELAGAVAEEARAHFGSDIGFGLAVRCEPGPNQDRTTGQIAMAVVGLNGAQYREHRVTAIPAEIRRRAALWAAEFLWRALPALASARRG